ncbi:hypothetical protein SAMN05443667_101244 [Flavobacterium gillisiae]|uniref:Uncharacterized protein n=1 Tax=Flavobacterium gillisiae TaxID=150146 RepID=A0A1H3WU56_9FLAO|nr:hypothetical protein [Flavobacterium gillisiae]SDZ90685.1 hypothetical protein SAMN05443667_101244 [Flavobacterium gillisiae]
MKLIATIYNSPIPTEGIFNNVEINDVQLIINSNGNYFSVKFDMTVEKNGNKVLLDTVTLGFEGNEGDEVSSNRTTTISILNPDFNTEIEESKERIVVALFDYLTANGGVLPTDFFFVDYGYPTGQKAKATFIGGELNSPKLFLEDPFAREWLLNTIVMKGEKIGVQFQFSE